MNEPQKTALRILGESTRGWYIIDSLAGPAQAHIRQAIMSLLLGAKVPKAKAGITAIRAEFYRIAGIGADCLAHQEESFTEWAKSQDNRISDPHSPMCGSPAF